MKHIDILKEKTKRRIPRRFMGILLAAAVAASALPTGGFAVSDSTERTTELCAHHSAHTAECGYSEEDNSPCGYECGVCPVEDLIAALPDKVTEDNEEEVRAQLDEILDLFTALNEDEQGQIDLSRCYELQEALDNANAPVMAAGVETTYIDASKVEQTQDCTLLESSSSSVDLSGGWYVVNGDVTIDGELTFNGETHLVLADGCKLTVNNINTTNLTIYGQSQGTGTLLAGGEDVYAPAIGYADPCVVSKVSITINGGCVNAYSDTRIFPPYANERSVIGGLYTSFGDSVTINGGVVYAVDVAKGGRDFPKYGLTIHSGIVVYNDESYGSKGTVYGTAGLPSGGQIGSAETESTIFMTMEKLNISQGATLTGLGYWKSVDITMEDLPDDFEITLKEGINAASTDQEIRNGIQVKSPYTDIGHTGAFTIAGLTTEEVTTITRNEDGECTANFTKNGKTVTKTFSLSKGLIQLMNVTLPMHSYSYTGSAIEPEVTVTVGDKVLTKGTDYTVTYADNIEIGTATITVTGIGNYEGTATGTFTINDADTLIEVEYVDESGVVKTAQAKAISTSNDSDLTLKGGWYFVQGTAARGNILAQIRTDSYLILPDGCSLNVTKGLNVQGNLTIYGQSGNSGTLTVKSSTNDASLWIQTVNLTVNGGKLTVKNSFGNKAIDLSSGRTFTYNGTSENFTVNGDFNSSGTLQTERLTEDMIAVDMESLPVGTNEDLSAEVGQCVTLTNPTYAGKEFALTGWTQSVDKVDDTTYTVAYTHAQRGTVSKTVTLDPPCAHPNLTYQDQGDGTCGGTCPDCNETISLPHQWSEQGVCENCHTQAVAMAEKDGKVIGYYGKRKLEKAFAKDSGNSGATITMLVDVELYDYLGINTNCTLDLNGKTIRVTRDYNPALSIYNSTTLTITGNGKVISDTGYALFINGNVTLNGGTFIGNGTNAGVYVDSRAILSVSGENVAIQGKDGYGLSVNYANSVRLSAGKYSGGAAAIACLKDLTLGDMLTEGCAYYNGDTPIPLSELAGQKELTGGVFTVKKCGHDGITPTDNGNGTHSVNCPYCGYTKAAENCAYTFSGATGTCAACGDSVTVSVTDNLIYDGTEKKPEVTVTRAGTELTVGTDYTVAYTDNKNAGTATVTVTIGNGQGSFTGNFIINPAAPTITWSGTSQELTYTGNPAAITAPIVTLVNGENFSGAISYSYKKQGETDYTNGLPVNAGAYSVKAHIDAAGNYAAADSTELTLTIAKAQGTLTVPASPIEKTFGDEEFALNCTTNGDGRIFYSSDNENVATVSADGTVLIKGAGEAEITVSLGEGENYTGADAQTVRIAVAKAAATDNISETKNYTYANGSKGTVTIDVAGKLPRDRGETTYSVSTTDDNGILTGAAADENGNLVFTVSGGVVGNTASITVTAEMANYGDATYTLNIKLVEKKVVEPKTAVTVKGSNILTYGETLSGLAFNSVIFVEQGTETEVKGTLSWKNPDTIPTVGTKSAEWVFTPEDNGEYAELTGTAAITVVKATPNVKAPTAENITYDPLKTLPDVGLSGGSAVWTVGDSSITVEGVWSWKSASTVPTVRNSGYTAVFTPSDIVNYNTAECTVAVTVAKAEPYIAVPPTAAQITYGDSLSDSVLGGGTVQYSNSDATAVAGGFAWKDGTIKPVVSDSGSTEYAVIFTPTDTANYNSTETKLTLTVKKVENAPNMPSDVMNVKRSCEKVSDVELPKDWQWQDADKDTALEINVGIKATAVYVGTDKGNYEHETVEVTITRADCDHIHTELRNVKAATCKEKGYSGDTYCLDCGKLLLKGSETDTTDHSGGVATCIHGKICDMCGTEYTEKNSANHTHTEIRGAKDATCTAEGYTGDTYCMDCKTITETGTALPIVPHDWQVTSEKPATTVSEGKRIYTCSMCKQTREETIPKLPQPSHKHSYTEKTTKEATCTESGEMILSCSCGDTIIRSISALGHNYRSEVTKPATVTEAGVMTYTCTRCGHSYTEPIKKLEDDPTKPDTRPETGKPFIKDENGKNGWEVINEEIDKAEGGSTVNVDMNGATVVPGNVFDTLRGRDVTVVFDMGGGITWSVNGKDVTFSNTSDIDLSVKSDTENIPVDVINNITGERYSIQISLAHNGEFGFTAVLSINLGSGNAGRKASLYYYNGGALEFICKSEISADGTARLKFTHASDYLIVIGESKTDESDNSGTTSSGEVSDSSNGDKDDNDGNPSTGVAVSLIPLAAAAAFIIAAAKRKNK